MACLDLAPPVELRPSAILPAAQPDGVQATQSCLTWVTKKGVSQMQACCILCVHKDRIQRQFFSPPWLLRTLSREKPHNEFLQQALPLKSLTSPFLCRMQSDNLQSTE